MLRHSVTTHLAVESIDFKSMRIHPPSERSRSTRSFLNSLVEGTRQPLRLGSSGWNSGAGRPHHLSSHTSVAPVPNETNSSSPSTVELSSFHNSSQSIPCPSINTAIDVHNFDHHWQIPSDLPEYTRTERDALYSWAMEKLPDSAGLRLIIRDTGLAPNHDPRSGTMACELLTAILGKAKQLPVDAQRDLFVQLAEQMHDMYATGQCPQGRSTRLYQIWLTLP